MGASPQVGSLTDRPSHGPRVVTFLSDFGLDDHFVGACHLVIARVAPHARVIDLGHGAADVRSGAVALRAAVPYAPRGSVHLAVVDPGVGTDRRGVAVGASDGSWLVGPDNGLLLPAADTFGGIVRCVELTSRAHRLHPASSTFHGRDVFAPAAGHLAADGDPAELGPELDPAVLVTLPPPWLQVEEGALEAEVVACDRFGNLQLSARPDDLAAAGLTADIQVVAGGVVVPAIVGRTFGDAPVGGLVVLVDSSGSVAVAANGASASARLGRPGRLRLSRRTG